MTKRKIDGEDHRKPEPFRTLFGRLRQTAVRTFHHTAITMDRMIRRLETPAPRLRGGIEPGFGGPVVPVSTSRQAGVEATLMAVDGLSVKASAVALQAIARFDPESADETRRSAARALAEATARAAEDYAAITAETLGVATPLATEEPVWASGLERRFSAIIAAAEALLVKTGEPETRQRPPSRSR